MSDLSLFGTFKEEKGIGATAEPYKDPSPFGVPGRNKGAQIVVPDATVRTGRGRDTWLDKNLQLVTQGDRYQDPPALDRMLAQRATAIPISDKPFRPTNPAANAGRNKGSMYGTFNPIPIMAPSGTSSGTRPATSPGPQPRNLYTSTPKVGGPGRPDQYRLMGGVPYTYVPDEYQRARIVEKSMKREARAKIARPFMGGSRPGGCFTPDSQLYAHACPLRPPSRARSTPGPGWRPNSRPPKDHVFSSSSYMPNPEPDKQRRSASPSPKPFVPADSGHKRLSMWAPNPYERDARPPPDPDGTLLL